MTRCYSQPNSAWPNCALIPVEMVATFGCLLGHRTVVVSIFDTPILVNYVGELWNETQRLSTRKKWVWVNETCATCWWTVIWKSWRRMKVVLWSEQIYKDYLNCVDGLLIDGRLVSWKDFKVSKTSWGYWDLWTLAGYWTYSASTLLA